MEPGKTSFFQALGIPTKIARGTIEIVSDVVILKKGDKVGASEAALLNMLAISPFTYGLSVVNVFDSGAIFSPDVLDVDDETMIKNLQTGITNIAAICKDSYFIISHGSQVPYYCRCSSSLGEWLQEALECWFGLRRILIRSN